ncbi:PREDICTED: amidophosphoribosyltransferase-like isoform X1 [Nicrophorus vespilloides]|uniref:Amidophosphoribosyltransferase n=1 Tax=Nicrophorus vespilloides TaxID=110193 RepID=A0ABM1NK15_NICVS|nr:PREDICTED: amidophosphoribosyltransferase-like isoform X1 [Nicrophorus vespilloides]
MSTGAQKKTYFDKRKEARGKVSSGLTHECGVFGAISSSASEPGNFEVAQLILVGLEALQHRGQESGGIVTSEGSNHFHIQKGMGLVRNIFNGDNIKNLVGHLGIGHTRYSTSAASESVNCQPFVVHSMHGSLAVAHNGELVNCASLRKKVLDRGVGLSTHSDSELISQALCLIPPEGEVDGPDWPARIKHLMHLAPLSYSAVIMLKDRIYAVRDPYGNRPLCLGKFVTFDESTGKDVDDGWIVSSESCAFLNPMQYMREILPGEIVEMSREGVKSISVVARPENKSLAFCIFEYVYFARPNSVFEGQEVYTVRLRCGEQLAIEHPVEADVVGSVPESGNAAAHGFSRQSKIPFGELLTKNTYVGRTFIQPSNRLRQLNVALKFSPISTNVMGKRVILIDDSIVRGNTIGQIIKLLRKAGAKEVHIRVASPPLRYPCYMGINIPTKKELIANSLDCKELAKEVGADSLQYLSVDGLVTAVQRDIKDKGNDLGHCTACLTGVYPGGVPEDLDW